MTQGRRGQGWPARAVAGPVLVALTAALSLESFRVLFPVMYGQADTRGNEAAAAMVLAVFAVGFLVPVARRLLGPRAALAAAVGALAGWRLAIPLFGHVPLPLAVFGAVAALLATTLVLTEDFSCGAEVTGLALFAGLGLDVAIRASFATWDPVWQGGPLALAVGVVLAAALGLALVAVLRSGERGPRPAAAVKTVGGGVAVGALLALEVLFLLSPGFVASSAGISLPWSALVVLGGVALAVVAFVATWQVRATSSRRRGRRRARRRRLPASRLSPADRRSWRPSSPPSSPSGPPSPPPSRRPHPAPASAASSGWRPGGWCWR